MAENSLGRSFSDALGTTARQESLEFHGFGTLDSAYAVSELAAESIATAGLAVGALVEEVTGNSAPVVVDRALACAWFSYAVRPIGWELPSPWDSVAGDYETADGWIRLHTNAPHHKAAALFELGVGDDKSEVAAAVRTWRGEDLELAIVSAGGCAAVMHTESEWAAHPQGRALADEPLVDWVDAESGAGSESWAPTPLRPLAGLKVLDLTRVIAGPVATRFLAGLGADVLRIDPPHWDEPAVVADMTLGKRTARLDARVPAGLVTLRELIAHCDILVHGYRADVLDHLGLGPSALQELRSGLIDVALNAYGWTGAWRNRRGFDSLVQMSSGIAERGMHWASASKPTPLPVQALDHATGYLAAAAALEGLRRRAATGTGSIARLSLARTALELTAADEGVAAKPAPEFARSTLNTPWGDAELLPSPITFGGHQLRWDLAPRDLGSDQAQW